MISAKELTVVIDGRTLVDHVSFDVAQGDSLGLVGPNGSGKSTVLRCLLGLVPFEGAVRIGGFDIVRDPVRAKELVGYLPQRPAFGDARALEVLRFVARLRRLPLSRCDEVLAEVGLSDFAAHKARTFSGGMQQRLSLAVALLTHAPVLLLDEPTASLDAEGQRTFLEIARLLRAQGRTLVICSHREEEIARVTDRVLELDKGRARERSVPRLALVGGGRGP